MGSPKRAVLVTLGCIGLLFVMGCNFRGCNRGMIGSKSPGIMDFEYLKFVSTEQATVAGERGQTLWLNYKVKVISGQLLVRIEGPSGKVIWEQAFSADRQDAHRFAMDEDGRYRVLVEGKNTEGGFLIEYRVD